MPVIGRAGKRPKIRVSNSLELLRGNEKYFRSEIANLPKIPHVFPTWLLVFVRVRFQAVLFYPFWNLAHLLPYNAGISGHPEGSTPGHPGAFVTAAVTNTC